MSNPKHYKIFRYFDGDHLPKKEIPEQVNYVTQLSQRLQPVKSWKRGRIEFLRYYESAKLDASGETVGVDLIVEEHFAYVDVDGFARQRTQTITWYREDGTAGDTKVRTKVYNNSEGRTEGRRRRRNVIDQLSIAAVGMLAATETAGSIPGAVALASPYMDALSSEIYDYVESSSNSLQAAIAGATEPWMSNVIHASGATIRDYILGELQ